MPATKYSFDHVYENVTERTRAHFLGYAIAASPFPTQSIQTKFYSQYIEYSSIKAVQSTLEKYNLFYNKVRPHQSLASQPPLSYYKNLSKR